MIDATVSNDMIHNMMKEYNVWRNISARGKKWLGRIGL